MKNINWTYLSEAIHYYKGCGYSYVELPWAIPMSSIMLTCPSWELAYVLDDSKEGLVGSAEQAFLHQALTGKLPKGKYVSCGPCFRREPHVDVWHQTQFMKVELFQTIDSLKTELQQAMTDCYGFFKQYTSALQVVKTEIGWDIEVSGIEIGSYGVRTHEGLSWVYATGLAEPRFSSVLDLG